MVDGASQYQMVCGDFLQEAATEILCGENVYTFPE